MIAIANAPISWGAFELTVGQHPGVPDADALLDLLVEAGYEGVDLGPVGYLGRGEAIRSRLAERRLGLAGGYIELPFGDHVALADKLHELDELLDAFDEASAGHGPPPRPTVADAGAAHRRAAVGRAASDRSAGLDDHQWQQWASGMAIVLDRCRNRGYEPTLHPETGTFIEAEWEIDRALELTDIGLCLETGHQLVGGGDPLATLERWGDRINHVHVKDARRSVIDRVVHDGLPVEAIWQQRAFCALGQGDVPIAAILDRLAALGYSGWMVVEQDIFPGPGDPHDAQRDQLANRELLRTHGL